MPDLLDEEEDEDRDVQETETEDEKNIWNPDKKYIHIFCMYQIFVYMLNSGRQTVPLHAMIGQTQYSRDRSKSMITVLNHIPVSDSYWKVKNRRQLLMK